MNTPVDIDKLKELEKFVEQQPDEAILAFATWDVAGPWWKERAGKLAEAARTLIAKAERVDAMEAALREIADWTLPETGEFWDAERTQPISYGAQYGSNGERDHIRSLARNALSPKPEDGPADQGDLCSDCPPIGHSTDRTRCLRCPRRATLKDTPAS